MSPTAKRKTVPYRWHGCWELNKREAIARCRWFVVYEQLTATEFNGIVSGYSGGSAFEFEDFFVRLRNGKIASCVIDDVDRVTDKPASMEALHRRHRRRFNKDLDQYAIFQEFNYGWGYDVQYLVPSAIEKFGLIAEDEDRDFPGEFDLVGGIASASWVKTLLGDYFWASSPKILQPRMSRAEKSQRQAKAKEWIPILAKKAVELQRMWEKG